MTGLFDLWVYDLVRGTASRLTSDSKDDWFPVFSPDGKRILFRSNRDGGIYQKAVDGNAPDELFDKDERRMRASDWSRDGRYIIEEISDPKTRYDLWAVPLFGSREHVPYLRSQFGARFSPDSRWLAYVSNETGRDQVYVRAFQSAMYKRQISVDGGLMPVWSRDGKEIFYLAGSGKAPDTWAMMAVKIMGGPNLRAGIPNALFDVQLSLFGWFDVSNDNRFLIPARTDPPESPITVVNWASAIKR